jgi:hypothetical protein
MKRGTRRLSLRILQTVDADGAAAASNAVHHRQTRRAMLVEFSARFFNGLIRATTRRRGAHDLVDAHVRRAPVVSGHAATDVALGDDADQLAVVGILNDRRAATA